MKINYFNYLTVLSRMTWLRCVNPLFFQVVKSNVFLMIKKSGLSQTGVRRDDTTVELVI